MRGINSKTIVFIGGVHGVGKSTICKRICEELQLQSLSASELIKWSEVSEDPKSKLVENIPDTQRRLVRALEQQTPGNYLLDGHLCLFNSLSEVTRISVNTFELINPSFLSVITASVEEIRLSQSERGGEVYDVKLISEMQRCEIEHANMIAEHLRIPFVQVSRSSIDYLISNIKNNLKL